MSVSLPHFVATAAETPGSTRLLLDSSGATELRGELPATGCLACLRNKLANKSALNRMTVDAFVAAVDDHYRDRFITGFVEQRLETTRRSGKPLTAGTVLDLTDRASAIRQDMARHTAATNRAQTSFHLAHSLITPGSDEHNRLLEGIEGDCASIQLGGVSMEYWTTAGPAIARELGALMEAQAEPVPPRILRAVAAETLEKSLTQSLSVEQMRTAVAELANRRMGRPVYGPDAAPLPQEQAGRLTALLTWAQSEQWPIRELEQGVQDIVEELIRAMRPWERPVARGSRDEADAAPEAPDEQEAIVSFAEVGRDLPVKTCVASFPPEAWQEEIVQLLRLTDRQSPALEVPLRAAQKLVASAGEFALAEKLVLACDARYRGTERAGEAIPDEGPGSWEDMHSSAALLARRHFLAGLFGPTPEATRRKTARQFPMLRSLCREAAAVCRAETGDPLRARHAVYMLSAFWGPLFSSENPSLMHLPWFIHMNNHFLPDMLHSYAAFPVGAGGRYGAGRDDALFAVYDALATEMAPLARAFFTELGAYQ